MFPVRYDPGGLLFLNLLEPSSICLQSGFSSTKNRGIFALFLNFYRAHFQQITGMCPWKSLCKNTVRGFCFGAYWNLRIMPLSVAIQKLLASPPAIVTRRATAR